MIFMKNQLEKLLQTDISYTVDYIGNCHVYNYSLKKQKIHIMTLKISEKIIHIELIILPENLRNNGVGSKISDVIKDWGTQNNFHSIELFAIHESMKFWIRQGFQIIKENSNRMIYYLPKYIY